MYKTTATIVDALITEKSQTEKDALSKLESTSFLLLALYAELELFSFELTCLWI